MTRKSKTTNILGQMEYALKCWHHRTIWHVRRREGIKPRSHTWASTYVCPDGRVGRVLRVFVRCWRGRESEEGRDGPEHDTTAHRNEKLCVSAHNGTSAPRSVPTGRAPLPHGHGQLGRRPSFPSRKLAAAGSASATARRERIVPISPGSDGPCQSRGALAPASARPWSAERMAPRIEPDDQTGLPGWMPQA